MLPAAAQQQLGQDVVSAPTAGAVDSAAVERYVARHRAGLLAVDDPEAHARAVERLIEPLLRSTVSVAFRNAYTEALEPLLNDIMPATVGELPQGRITAMRIAGALATERSVARVLDALESEAEPIRFFACYSARRAFEATSRTSPAITPSTAERIVSSLATIVAEDQQPRLAGAAVIALQTAGDGENPPRIDGFPAAARSALADAARRRVVRLETDAIEQAAELDVLLRAGVAAQEAARTGTATTIRESVGYAGALLGIVLDRLERRIRETRTGGVDEQSPDARLAALAETILAIAGERELDNGGPGIQIPEIRAMLIRDDSGVRTEILGLIGSGGRLTEPPYAFRPTELGVSG